MTSAGGDASVRATDRLFFAVYPDAAARDEIAACAHDLARRHALRGKPFAPERFHATLAMAGDHAGLPDALVETVRSVGDAVHATPFEFVLDRVTTFPRARKQPCVLLAAQGSEAMQALHAALEAGLQRCGVIAAPERRFRPHLTLQYDDAGLPDASIAPIRWTVRSFVLMRSLLGRSRHVELARWPLDG